MKISRRRQYINALKDIMAYISKDSKNRAISFRDALENQIEDLVNFPYKYRQSFHSNNPNVRDMIHKGYTIIYHINTEDDMIEILEIFKYKNR